jgi:hypothetical protein
LARDFGDISNYLDKIKENLDSDKAKRAKLYYKKMRNESTQLEG